MSRRSHSSIRRRIVALAILALAACAEPPPARELPLEPLGDQPAADQPAADQPAADQPAADQPAADQPAVYGSVRITPSPRGHAGFTLSLTGLSPGETYVLCLNAQEPNSLSSETLGRLGIPGWPLGAFYPSAKGGVEGYWDFEKVQADAQGRFLRHFELPLPAMAYRVKLLVKTNQGVESRPVLHSQPLLLDVRGPLRVEVLTGTIAALAVIPLALIARGRGRRSRITPEQAHAGDREHAGHREHAGAFAPDPQATTMEAEADPLASAQPGCARTLVDRARAEGVFAHHKNYAWIEIHGRRKSFRPRQALVFRILCEHDPNCDGIPQDEIIKAWEEVFRAKRANPVRVRDIFRSCEHEPGDFIVRVAGPASVYRLRLEPTPPPSSPDPDSDLEGDASAVDPLDDDDEG
jgi:hypothetical protein